MRGNTIMEREAKQHLARNTATSIVFFIFNAGTSMYFVPLQIHCLGVGNYGMITLANQVVMWTGVITIALVGTIGRFVTLHLARGEEQEARRYFNTQLVASLGFAAVFLPITFVISYMTPAIFRVPAGQEHNSQILFFLTYTSFLVWICASAFQVSTYVRQRFDIKNIIEIGNQILRYSTWLLLFAIAVPSMRHIGIGYVLGTTVALVATIIASRRLTPELRPSLREFDVRKLREMLGMGGWMTVAQLGQMLYLLCDAVILNMMLGPAVVGMYGAVAGLTMMVRGLSGMVLGVIGPPAVAYAAKGDFAGMARLMTRAVKFQSLFLAIILGIMCGMSVPLLRWWLGPKFVPLALLLFLLMCHLPMNLGSETLSTVTYATNRMVAPAIATVAGGLLKVVLAIILIKYTRLGMYGVVTADIVSLSLKALVFFPVYTGKIMKRSSVAVYKALLPAMAVFIGASALSWKATHVFVPYGFIGLAVTGLILTVVVGTIAYRFALNSDERSFIRVIASQRRAAKSPA